MTRSISQHIRITVTTTDPGAFPRWSIVGRSAIEGAVTLQHYKFTDELADDLTDELAKIHGESLLAVSCERRWPDRRKGDR